VPNAKERADKNHRYERNDVGYFHMIHTVKGRPPTPSMKKAQDPIRKSDPQCVWQYKSHWFSLNQK